MMAHLELYQESGGSRPYLFGKAVHAGDCLEVLLKDKWYSARCECYREQGILHWYLIAFKPEGAEIIDDCVGSLWCRWE